MLNRLRTFLVWLENGFLVGLLLVILVAANTQILLRNLFEFAIVWIDPFLRITVLWLALMGAMVATREGSHIAIDALTRFLPRAWCLRMDRFIHAIGALVCVLIAYYSALLVQLEYGDGLYAFASVPVWLCEAIMPLAFAIMALRFLVSAIVGSDESPDRACL